MKNKYLKYLRYKEKLYFYDAISGWWFWHKLIKKHNINMKTAVVLLPIDDRENSYYALLYLDRMLAKRNYEAAIILTVDSVAARSAPLLSSKINYVELISFKQYKDLTQYYNLLLFDSRFIHASLTSPNGRNGMALNGVNGITVEEAVAIGVYKIIPFVTKQRPQYCGDDIEIADFMQTRNDYSLRRTTDKIR